MTLGSSRMASASSSIASWVWCKIEGESDTEDVGARCCILRVHLPPPKGALGTDDPQGILTGASA